MTETHAAFTDRTEFDAQSEAALAAAATYYQGDGSALDMTDAEYDHLVERIQVTLVEHPEWATETTDALTERVAAGSAPISGLTEVKHPKPMLSMEKVSAEDGEVAEAALAAFVARVADGQGSMGEVVVEPKMDGLALRVEYRDGQLVLAATRGDGLTGEDVTAQVLRGDGVQGLPKKLGKSWTGEVRGEVYMTHSQFEQAQVLRAERGGKPFVNPRNSTAGALRKTGEEHWMPLSFAAYDAEEAGAEPSEHYAAMRAAESLGIATAVGLLTARHIGHGPYKAPEVVQLTIDEIEGVRADLGFDIDGVVIKANDPRDRARLGQRSRTPNWALAWKYAADETSAVVEAIEVSVGRTGRIGLRARIKPTFVGGTTISFATLHNPEWVVAEGIGIGSKVVLKRAGDVIPRITAPLGEQSDVPTWAPPETCPQCGEPWNKDSLLWRCETPSCGLVSAISYLAARDCLDVEGLGGTVAEALAETVFDGGRRVEDVADLYALSLDDWAGLILGTTTTGNDRRLGEANARKIMLSLADSKKQPFHRVLTGLGIRGTGRSLSRAIAAAFPTMDRLRAASAADLAEVEKVGPIKAALIVEQLERLAPVIDKLAAHGLNMGTEPTVEDQAAKADLPLAGMTFVISGSVPGYGRTEAQEAIEAAGGKASSSVSAKTTALISGESGTSKMQKAEKLGVPIIDPADFEALLAGKLDGFGA